MSLLHKQVPNKHKNTMTAIHICICVKKNSSTIKILQLIKMCSIYYNNHLNSVHLGSVAQLGNFPWGGKTFQGGGKNFLNLRLSVEEKPFALLLLFIIYI